MKDVCDDALGRPAAAVLVLLSLLPACPGGQYRVDKTRDTGGPQEAPARGPDQVSMGDAGSPIGSEYTGLISVQDMAIANLPDAGHGPSVSSVASVPSISCILLGASPLWSSTRTSALTDMTLVLATDKLTKLRLPRRPPRHHAACWHRASLCADRSASITS